MYSPLALRTNLKDYVFNNHKIWSVTAHLTYFPDQQMHSTAIIMPLPLPKTAEDETKIPDSQPRIYRTNNSVSV